MSVPLLAVPEFRPTVEEFADFHAFVKRIEPLCPAGAAQIRPPPGWRPRKNLNYDDLDNLVVRRPIRQEMVGSKGVFVAMHVEQPRRTLEEFKRDAERYYLRCAPPPLQFCKPAEPAQGSNSNVETAAVAGLSSNCVDNQKDNTADSRDSDQARLSNHESSKHALNVSDQPSITGDHQQQHQQQHHQQHHHYHQDHHYHHRSASSSSSVLHSSHTSYLGNQSNPADAQDDKPSVHQPDCSVSNGKERSNLSSSSVVPSASARAKPVPQPTEESLTRMDNFFWRNVLFRQPVYGADLEGSLFESDVCDTWNLNSLESLLDLCPAAAGVHNPYLYIGMFGSLFCFHVEDADLYGINFLHVGAPKTWYTIPTNHRARFDALCERLYPDHFQNCKQFMRHKQMLISLDVLRKNNIPFGRVTQLPGTFTIVLPGVYHCGFNHGFNIAEAVNFATLRWLNVGKKAIPCLCQDDTVRIDVEALDRQLFPGKYTAEFAERSRQIAEVVQNLRKKKREARRRHPAKEMVTPNLKHDVAACSPERCMELIPNREHAVSASDVPSDSWQECGSSNILENGPANANGFFGCSADSSRVALPVARDLESSDLHTSCGLLVRSPTCAQNASNPVHPEIGPVYSTERQHSASLASDANEKNVNLSEQEHLAAENDQSEKSAEKRKRNWSLIPVYRMSEFVVRPELQGHEREQATLDRATMCGIEMQLLTANTLLNTLNVVLKDAVDRRKIAAIGRKISKTRRRFLNAQVGMFERRIPIDLPANSDLDTTSGGIALHSLPGNVMTGDKSNSRRVVRSVKSVPRSKKSDKGQTMNPNMADSLKSLPYKPDVGDAMSIALCPQLDVSHAVPIMPQQAFSQPLAENMAPALNSVSGTRPEHAGFIEPHTVASQVSQLAPRPAGFVKSQQAFVGPAQSQFALAQPVSCQQAELFQVQERHHPYSQLADPQAEYCVRVPQTSQQSQSSMEIQQHKIMDSAQQGSHDPLQEHCTSQQPDQLAVHYSSQTGHILQHLGLQQQQQLQQQLQQHQLQLRQKPEQQQQQQQLLQLIFDSQYLLQSQQQLQNDQLKRQQLCQQSQVHRQEHEQQAQDCSQVPQGPLVQSAHHSEAFSWPNTLRLAANRDLSSASTGLPDAWNGGVCLSGGDIPPSVHEEGHKMSGDSVATSAFGWVDPYLHDVGVGLNEHNVSFSDSLLADEKI